MDASKAKQLPVASSTQGALSQDGDDLELPEILHPGVEGRGDELTTSELPSFAQSQLHTIIRRQIARPRDGSGTKASRRPSRFANLPIELGFAGWGKVQWTTLSSGEITAAEESLSKADEKVLGQWVGAAVVGNDLLGSGARWLLPRRYPKLIDSDAVFYAFPVVAAVAGI